MSRLEPGGRLVMYTGVPILEGRDPLREVIEPAFVRAGADLIY
jgi:predicted methyltransferase